MVTNAGILGIRADWRTKQFHDFVKHLKAPRLNQALARGVNDAARQVERQAEKLVAQTLSVPAKRARQGVYIKPPATDKTLRAIIRGSNSEIPLKAFRAKEQGEGTTARIWGSRQFYPGAFIHGGPAKDRTRDLGMGGHVFYRKGKGRHPIGKAKGASIGEAMTQGAVRTAIEKHGDERLQANVLRQLDRYSRKARGKF